MNGSVRQWTGKEFEDAIQRPGATVLVDFWAPWCGPCVALGPVIEALANDLSGDVTVGKVNIDEHPALAERYGVSAIPTVLIFRDGAVVHRVVGIRPKSHYEALLQTAVA